MSEKRKVLRAVPSISKTHTSMGMGLEYLQSAHHGYAEISSALTGCIVGPNMQ